MSTLRPFLMVFAIFSSIFMFNGCEEHHHEEHNDDHEHTPEAAFSADSLIIDTAQSVTFTDASTNTPTNWVWTFQGGTPASSIIQNPSVTYNDTGKFDVTLVAGNGAGSDTETKVDYITVN